MLRSFDDIEKVVLNSQQKVRIALAAAHDTDALEALVSAKRAGIAEGVLIGDAAVIKRLLDEMGETVGDYEILERSGEIECAETAMSMVIKKDAHMPMKGLLQTSVFMKALLAKKGDGQMMPEGGILSQATILEYPDENRLMIATDCAVNIAPDYEKKVGILRNAANLAKQLGILKPKAAVVCPVEVVTPSMQSTVDAARMRQAYLQGEIDFCVVDGPFGLDNAVSVEAARHKGVGGEVAGRADILLMSGIEMGNVFTKSLVFFAKLRSSGNLLGTSMPVIMTSRSDTPENKRRSILVSAYQAIVGQGGN